MKMNIKAISKHVATVSTEARKNMAAGQWDEVMTDALYAACGAETTEEMAQARDIAADEASMIRLADVMMEVVAGNISTGKARETLREENYPAAVWQKVVAPLAV